MKKSILILNFTVSLIGQLFSQGPYAPPPGQNGSTAIHKDSSAIVAWATNCSISRGLQDISNASLGFTSVGTPIDATNKAGVNGVVSLGDGGVATLTFNEPIKNGIGPDFAVFENSFSNDFLELAFVEVSSDGINFFRFDAISLTDTTNQTGSFGTTDATEIYNLAGKYRAQYGTPFDLGELAGITGLDINNITHVKIIDVVGNINIPYATYDSQNTPINDPWPTAFASGGFDLDAVGVINTSSTSINEVNKELEISFYPNPSTDFIYINKISNKKHFYKIIDLDGSIVKSGVLENVLNINDLVSGIYFIKINTSDKLAVKKFIKK